MVCTLSPIFIPFSKIVPYGIPLADERTTREAQVSSTGHMMTKPKRGVQLAARIDSPSDSASGENRCPPPLPLLARATSARPGPGAVETPVETAAPPTTKLKPTTELKPA